MGTLLLVARLVLAAVFAAAGVGLSSPVLLAEQSEARTAFRASGTPMGVLVDWTGRVASPLAVGAPALLALAGQAEVH